MLSQWKAPPRHLLVNNTPIYDGEAYITLQNMGISYVPYRVFNRAEFVRSLERCYYAVEDCWKTERTLSVPLHPDLYVAGYVSISRLALDGPPPVCRYLALPVFCGPLKMPGEPDLFYSNNGDGTFSDATATAGLTEHEPQFGFTVVATDFNGSLMKADAVRKMVIEQTPLGRMAEPEDVADAVAFLASSDARFVTGQRIELSGGFRL